MNTIKKQPYAICAGHRRTAEAAADVLDAGGNAVDAAIAAYWMMMLAEPCMSSVGAGGFATLFFEQSARVLDFFCQTPQKKRHPSDYDFYPVTVDFGATTEDFYVGRGSSAVPGAIAGLFALHDAYGTVPMTELASITVTAASEGVVLDRFQAYDWDLLKDIYAIEPSVRHIYFRQDGTLKEEGDLVRMPQLGDAVEALAREGADLFYQGEMARKVTGDMKVDGSLTMRDLGDYQAVWHNPLTVHHSNYQIHTVPPPSAGGPLIAAMLLDLGGHDDIDDQLMAEVSRRMQVLTNDHSALRGFLDSHGVIIDDAPLAHKWGGTSHFNVVDRKGNAVALTSSIGEGNGYFIPGTEMQLNNMLGELALLPHGFHSWEPNVRLRSMMAPTLVTEADRLRLVLGSGGAGRIPQMIAQVVAHYIGGSSLAHAVERPRVFHDGETLHMEPGFRNPSLDILTNLWPHKSLYFGGTHAIGIGQSGVVTVAPDHRRHGYGIVA